MNKKKVILIVVIMYLQLFLMMAFQLNFLMSFPISARIVITFLLQWFFLIMPIIGIKKKWYTLADYGFSKDNIVKQILIGLVLGLIFVFFTCFLPILAGLREWVGSQTVGEAWMFIYYFFYIFFAVALVEEILFRGFLFNVLYDMRSSKWFAIIVSSVIFGFFHILQGSIIQVIVTTFIGLIFCLAREKIKDCTTLSLIVFHGVNNFMIIFLLTVM